MRRRKAGCVLTVRMLGTWCRFSLMSGTLCSMKCMSSLAQLPASRLPLPDSCASMSPDVQQSWLASNAPLATMPSYAAASSHSVIPCCQPVVRNTAEEVAVWPPTNLGGKCSKPDN